jgi:hypothetical protein
MADPFVLNGNSVAPRRDFGGGKPLGAAPTFAVTTIETRGVPNRFCGSHRKDSGLDPTTATLSLKSSPHSQNGTASQKYFAYTAHRSLKPREKRAIKASSTK